MALKDSYLSLITSQHKDKPKFAATISKLLQYSEDVFAVAIYLDDEFDFELAEGRQQDTLGDVIGSFRSLDFAFGAEQRSMLNDDEYRVLQQAKIIKNHWNGKIEDLYEKWMLLFGTSIQIKDNQDMTLDIKLDIDESAEMKALMKFVGRGLVVPKPQSVGFKYQFKYPDIILPIEIRHRTEITQAVDAHQCIWNLGSARTTRWNGEFRFDGTIRYNGIYPDEMYREKQVHRAEITAQVDARQASNGHMANLWDGGFCWNASHRWNGAQERSIMSHCCTVTTIKNGVEGVVEPV